jgi:hypothetical protein
MVRVHGEHKVVVRNLISFFLPFHYENKNKNEEKRIIKYSSAILCVFAPLCESLLRKNPQYVSTIPLSNTKKPVSFLTVLPSP